MIYLHHKPPWHFACLPKVFVSSIYPKSKMEFKEVEGSSCINLFFELGVSKLLRCNTRIHMNFALSM